MPKGIYERKKGTPKTMTDCAMKARAANWAKALEAQKNSEKATAAKRRNAGKAVAVRTGRAILKKLPVGAQAGLVFQATRYRKLTVIDASPLEITENDETVWEQKFHQSGKIVIYGSTHEFDGACRIVWHEKPTLENIMNEPLFEEIIKAGGPDE